MAYTLKLHPLGLDVLLLAVLVWWSLRRSWSSADRVLAGLTLGLNLMARPTFFVAGLAAWIARLRMHPRELRAIVGAVVVAMVVVTPWLARNWVLLGQPLLVSTGFEDIWKGNNAVASDASYVAPGRRGSRQRAVCRGDRRVHRAACSR